MSDAPILPVYVLSHEIFPTVVRAFIPAALFDCAYVCKQWRDCAQLSMRRHLAKWERDEIIGLKMSLSDKSQGVVRSTITMQRAFQTGDANMLWLTRDTPPFVFVRHVYGACFEKMFAPGVFSVVCLAILDLFLRRGWGEQVACVARLKLHVRRFVSNHVFPNHIGKDSHESREVFALLNFFRGSNFPDTLVRVSLDSGNDLLIRFVLRFASAGMLNFVFFGCWSRRYNMGMFEACITACEEETAIFVIERMIVTIFTWRQESILFALAHCLMHKPKAARVILQTLPVTVDTNAFFALLDRQNGKAATDEETKLCKELFLTAIAELHN